MWDRERELELVEDIEFIEQQLRRYAEPNCDYQRRVLAIYKAMLASKQGFLEVLRKQASA
jgi:hypothetical protein